MSRDESSLLFAPTHEWTDIAEENGVKVATVGISAFALQQLNDLVYMDLPEVGRVVDAGEEMGEVESVKAVSPLYSPVAGEIVEVHTELPDSLEKLNEDPYDFGWIVKVKLQDDRGVDQLMDFDAYKKQCAESA
jgi:glycine cleavage system H protein